MSRETYYFLIISVFAGAFLYSSLVNNLNDMVFYGVILLASLIITGGYPE